MRERAVSIISSRRALACVALAAAAFTTGSFLAPLAAERDHPAAGPLYLLYTPLCHQQPGRSLAVAGEPQAVCARCSGLYVGGALGLLVALSAARRVRPRPLWLAVAAAPTLVDVALNLLGGAALANVPRFLVAAPAGLVLGLYLAEGISDVVARGLGPATRVEPPRIALEEADG